MIVQSRTKQHKINKFFSMTIFKVSSVIEFWERCLQWITVFLYMTYILVTALAGWLLWGCLVIFVPILRYPLLVYIAWIYYDRKSGPLGARRSNWVRNWKCWKYHNEYFPVKLHKTVDLPPDKNYLFCTFPHGILVSGCFASFGHNRNRFSELFPGLTSCVITLAQHFYSPFIREFVMSIGALPASADCLNYFLSKNKGVALALVVGGAQEAFYMRPGVYKIVAKRKGFVKIAIKNGTSLVPTISFGEPDIYDQIQFPENSFLRKFQTFCKDKTKIAPILFYGQFGYVPFRKPLNVVVGKPIDVEKKEEPTQQEVNDLHAKFIEALINLFESEKHKYIENAENTHLEFA